MECENYNYFEKLPQEIKEMIFNHLNLSDLLNRHQCASIKRLVNQNVWSIKMYAKDMA